MLPNAGGRPVRGVGRGGVGWGVGASTNQLAIVFVYVPNLAKYMQVSVTA